MLCMPGSKDQYYNISNLMATHWQANRMLVNYLASMRSNGDRTVRNCPHQSQAESQYVRRVSSTAEESAGGRLIEGMSLSC